MPNSPVVDQEAAYLHPGEASRLARLSTKQLTRLADDGRIRYIRPGTHRRYLREDVEALVMEEKAS